jgi:hypothetical protein
VFVGGGPEDAGCVISAIDVDDVIVALEIVVIEFSAAILVAVEGGEARLGRRSSCRRRSKSMLLCPKSSVMKWAVSFQGDGDVCNVMSCSLLLIETPDTLQNVRQGKFDDFPMLTYVTRAPHRCCSLHERLWRKTRLRR